MVTKFKDRYYWYGEHKGADNCLHQTRVDAIGFYTSAFIDQEKEAPVLLIWQNQF